MEETRLGTGSLWKDKAGNTDLGVFFACFGIIPYYASGALYLSNMAINVLVSIDIFHARRFRADIFVHQNMGCLRCLPNCQQSEKCRIKKVRGA